MPETLHLLALALYGCSAVLALAQFAGFPPTPRGVAVGVPAAGVALHAAGLVQLAPVGFGPAVSTLALCIVLGQIAAELALHGDAVALFTAPLAAGLTGLAVLAGLEAGLAPPPSATVWLGLHVTLSALGVALLTLAGVAAALYLLQFRELKVKRFGSAFAVFPPLERLDALNRLAILAGFPALTLGAILALGEASRSPHPRIDAAQVTWGAFTWIVLAVVAWLRIRPRWTGRRAALVTLVGCAAVALVYLALKVVVPGSGRFL